MSPSCLNCGAPLSAPYCGQCGQSGAVHPYSIAGLLHDIPHAVFHLDRGLWPTLLGLLRAPGETVRNYLDGQRVRYFNPLTLLVLCVGLYVACYSRADFLPLISRMTGTRLQAAGLDPLQWATRFMSLLLLVIVPLQAWGNWLFFRRGRRNLAEHMVAIAFVNALTTLLMVIPLFPLLWVLAHLGPKAQAAVGPAWLAGVIISTSYQTWAVGQIFDEPGLRPSAQWRAQLGMGVVVLVMVLIGAIAGFTWVLLRR
ncbi:DUF3667 domain-containing protein [Inhella sp.]|uniref:DUF3667 domain-containing protein n=1 Tax=Inhella sp. TaxID=1921806 RepID=UPI0035B25512